MSVDRSCKVYLGADRSEGERVVSVTIDSAVERPGMFSQFRLAELGGDAVLSAMLWHVERVTDNMLRWVLQFRLQRFIGHLPQEDSAMMASPTLFLPPSHARERCLRAGAHPLAEVLYELSAWGFAWLIVARRCAWDVVAGTCTWRVAFWRSPSGGAPKTSPGRSHLRPHQMMASPDALAPPVDPTTESEPSQAPELDYQHQQHQYEDNENEKWLSATFTPSTVFTAVARNAHTLDPRRHPAAPDVASPARGSVG
ncbi:hypothetical protein C8R45DRAFT_1099808 [Mycena sanguinolenta]|nr:hypothetical protein C8R45DRAFT_1099808 [Mycena sanguinolenta]